MARVSDGTDVPVSPVPASSSNWVLPTVLVLTLKGQDFAPVRWRRKSTKSNKTRLGLKIAPRRLLRQWPPRRLRLQMLNKWLGALWLALPLWKQMQPLAPTAMTRQDLGTCLDIVTAPQPLGPSGPMAQGHLMTIGIRDVDLILSQALKMNMHEVVLLRFPCEQYHTWITNCINNLWENHTFQPITNPSEFIAKQVPCQPDSYSKQEPSVRTLWPDTKKMVSPIKLTVLSATPKQLSRSANPIHLKTWRSESNLRLCGECWPNSSKFSSLMVMAKVPLLSLHSTPVHKFSASKIEETALENLCSNLPFLEAVSFFLHFLHLTCVFLAFLMVCCNGAFSPPGGWVLHVVISLTHCLTVHVATSCPMEDPLHECGRPCDTMSSLFFTALWLQRGQSILDENSASQGHRLDVLQDIADQGQHMLTNGAHIL